jgi:MoaA/NifB/PqqE/SkfB family radical SAM enzyme
MIELREQFLKGEKPKTCQRCWDEENSGRASKRINSKIRLSDMINDVDFSKTTSDNLIFLDLKLGNICNLKCRICGSWSSSKWVKEEVDYVPKEHRKQHQAYQFLKQGAWPRESEKFWNEIEVLLPKIRYLEFTGGEPFLIDQHFNLLERAVDLGYSKQIEIHYNTNGTVFPAKHHLWKWFKHVEIAFSIDNTEERFEYERYGAKWDEVQENIRKFNDVRSNKLSTQLCWTANIQNVYYLPEICEWISKQTFDHVFFNRLHDPWHMCISKMNLILKTKWKSCGSLSLLKMAKVVMVQSF